LHTDLPALLTSWKLAMRAERKSQQTVSTYDEGVRQYLRWCEGSDVEPDLSRASVAAWLSALLDGGAQPATARARYMAVRRFSAWLLEEGEIATDHIVGMKPPGLDTKVVDPLTEAELRALLKSCASPALKDRRDEAILRFMLETGARAGEVIALTVSDIDLQAGTAIVRRGNGGKSRSVPFSAQPARAIDRCLRIRKAHRLAGSTDAVWLGGRGQTFRYDALYKSLGDRAAAAGVADFHPHRLRHTAAHRWLAAGGSEGGGLMAVAAGRGPTCCCFTRRPRRPRGPLRSPQPQPGGSVTEPTIFPNSLPVQLRRTGREPPAVIVRCAPRSPPLRPGRLHLRD
jgi:site-specific recombinase XerD